MTTWLVTLYRVLVTALSIVPLLAGGACGGGASQELGEDEIAMTSRTPMYGQPEEPRPAHFKKADDALVRGYLEEYEGDRRAASLALWNYGEGYLAEGKPNLATSRYNQSWLIDSTNYQPYWGFGRALIRRGDLNGAIKHLETARRLNGDSPNVALLTTLGTAYSLKAASLPAQEAEAKARYFAAADRQFEECLRLDPEYGNGWRLWAEAMSREKKYTEAWRKVATARRFGVEPSDVFLVELRAALPEPE